MRYRSVVDKAPELAVLLVNALVLAFFLGALGILQALGASAVQGSGLQFTPLTLAVMTSVQVGACAIVMLWARWTDGFSSSALGLVRPRAGELAVGLLGGAVYAGGQCVWALAGKGMTIERTPSSAFPPHPAVWFAATLLLLIPANTLKEELLSRAYGIARMRTRGVVLASLFSSLLFALLHFVGETPTATRFVQLTAAGLFFSLVYLRTRSIWPAVCAHAAWNLGLAVFSGNPVFGGVLRYTRAVSSAWDLPVDLGLIAVAAGVVFALTQGRADGVSQGASSRGALTASR